MNSQLFITNIVRALINSRKQPCQLNDILRDFREEENSDLDRVVRDFGFKTAYDFFFSSNEFILQTIRGIVHVSTRPNEKSAHVSQLVREQKSSKKTTYRLSKPTPLPRKNLGRPGTRSYANYRHLESTVARKYPAKYDNVKRHVVTQPRQQVVTQHQPSTVTSQPLKPTTRQPVATPLQPATLRQQLTRTIHQPITTTHQPVTTSRPAEDLKFEEEKKKWKAELEAFEKKINEERLRNVQLSEQMKKLEHENANLRQSATNGKAIICNLVEPIDEDLDIEKAEIDQLKKLKENIASVAFDSRDLNNNHNNKNESNNKDMQKLDPIDLRHRIIEKRLNHQAAATNTEKNLRPILGQKSIEVNKPNKNNTNLKVIIPKEEKSVETNLNQTMTSKMPQNIEIGQPSVQTQKTRIKSYANVQERLKTRLNGDVGDDGSVSPAEKLIPKSPLIPHVDEPKLSASKISKISSNREINSSQKSYKFDSNLDPCASIEQYCRAMDLEKPNYTTMRTKLGTFCSQITVQNTTYSTYPLEFPNELIARQHAAHKAVKEIEKLMSRKQLPPFPDESKFLDILYDELKKQPNGILSNKLEDWFAERFRYSVPKLWFAMVQKSRRFTMEQGVNEHTWIVLANTAVQSEEINPADILKESTYQMKALKLPWSERNWNLHVTNTVSTIEIWAQLLSPGCSDRLNALTSEIENYMARNKMRPTVIAAKHIYLVEAGRNVHRVRVETIDKAEEMALVFHIDYGKTDRLPFSALYNCPFEFLDLPPQAVPFSLFGLDDFASFPNATEQLQKTLLNRRFIGKVITKEVDFEADSSIQMIMYDTSTDEDINMNDSLQEKICRSTALPKLKSDDFTQVIVTHVDGKTGHVSLQLNMDYVKNTLNRIIKSKFSQEQHKCGAEELLRKQVLLVKYDSKWFRAKVADDRQVQYVLRGGEQDIDLIFIDYNIKRCVNISQIFRLESLSRALSAYPAQTILAKLHNITEFSPIIIGRIRSLLPESCEVQVRVDIPGEVPCVTIYRRFDGPEMPFCNINDDLRLEIESQKSSSDGCGPALTPDSITSPTQRFRSLALTYEVNLGELPKLKEYTPLPTVNSLFSVRVCNVSNPMMFSVQAYNNDYQKLMDMQRELQEYCDKQDVYIPSDKVEKNEAYAAKIEDAYYRVIAKSRYGKMINVSRCDYGDNGTVKIDHLKVLPLKFRNLPIMGINARLYGIKGSADDIWSKEDVERFQKLVLNQKLFSYVRAIERSEDNSLLLTLDLVNVAGKNDIYIKDVLFGERRAKPL